MHERVSMLVPACVNGNTAMTIRDDCHGFLSLLDIIPVGLVIGHTETRCKLMRNLSEKLYISTIADNAAELAHEYGLGLEIAEFCTAYNMDIDFEKWDALVHEKMHGISRFTFHAPYNELCPAALDPLIVDVTKKRYAQAYTLMCGYGIKAMIVHSGFVPALYHESWFEEKSVMFWKEFISDKPADFRLYLENMLEPSPRMLCDIVKAVNDKRFRLCLDIGHAAYMGASTPIETWVERTLPYLRHVHIHNNYGEYDSHNVPDDGKIDVRSIIQRILETVTNVTFTIESIDAKASMKWLKESGLLPRSA